MCSIMFIQYEGLNEGKTNRTSNFKTQYLAHVININFHISLKISLYLVFSVFSQILFFF